MTTKNPLSNETVTCPHCGSFDVHEQGRSEFSRKFLNKQKWNCDQCIRWFEITPADARTQGDE